jgi:hypothetical protein
MRRGTGSSSGSRLFLQIACSTEASEQKCYTLIDFFWTVLIVLFSVTLKTLFDSRHVPCMSFTRQSPTAAPHNNVWWPITARV